VYTIREEEEIKIPEGDIRERKRKKRIHVTLRYPTAFSLPLLIFTTDSRVPGQL